jgi:hypothetical protein
MGLLYLYLYFTNVSTYILNIPNGLLDAIGLILMQQEIRTNRLFDSLQA